MSHHAVPAVPATKAINPSEIDTIQRRARLHRALIWRGRGWGCGVVMGKAVRGVAGRGRKGKPARGQSRRSVTNVTRMVATAALWIRCAVTGAISDPRHSRIIAKTKPSAVTGSSRGPA